MSGKTYSAPCQFFRALELELALLTTAAQSVRNHQWRGLLYMVHMILL